jgi:hypothetical protein
MTIAAIEELYYECQVGDEAKYSTMTTSVGTKPPVWNTSPLVALLGKGLNNCYEYSTTPISKKLLARRAL